MPDRTRGQRPTSWAEWHREYDDPGSRLSARLRTVQRRLRIEIDRRPGALRVISMCAGEGRDVIGVLAGHPRRHEIDGLLVELDPTISETARSSASATGLDRVRVRAADAARTESYADAVPADIVLACGIFGNISDEDIRRTIAELPRLCADGAAVIWTRGWRAGNDAPNRIRRWFAASGFTEVAFEAPTDATYRVGVHRLASPPLPFDPTRHLFTFTRLGREGDDRIGDRPHHDG